jgi:hypothetical protein
MRGFVHATQIAVVYHMLSLLLLLCYRMQEASESGDDDFCRRVNRAINTPMGERQHAAAAAAAGRQQALCALL